MPPDLTQYKTIMGNLGSDNKVICVAHFRSVRDMEIREEGRGGVLAGYG